MFSKLEVLKTDSSVTDYEIVIGINSDIALQVAVTLAVSPSFCTVTDEVMPKVPGSV